MTKQERVAEAHAAFIKASAAEGAARGEFDAACEFGAPHSERRRLYRAYSAASTARCVARLALTAAIHGREE